MNQKAFLLGRAILIIGTMVSLLFSTSSVESIADTPRKVVTDEYSFCTNGFETPEDVLDGEFKVIQEVSELFISSCFSTNSNLKGVELIDSHALTFLDYVKNRHSLINLRREAFSNLKVLENISLQFQDVYKRDDIALARVRSKECYFYTDDPNHYAVSIIEYLLFLRNTDSEWKVYWATSNDAYSKMMEEQTDFSKIYGLVIPWCKGDALYSELQQTEPHSTEIMIQFCNDFPYRNFDELRANEEINIAKELDEAQHNAFLPLGTGNFSRFAMKNYQNNWALSRNPAWGDYSEYGGDCQNYVSQVIKAGGAPFDELGSYKWYWYSDVKRTPSWTGVNSMQTYISYNSGLGPNGIFVSSASSLLTGDMVHIDWNSNGTFDHAVAIYNPGSSPTVSGHTEDCINKRLSDYPGTKKYIHLTQYGY